MLIVLTALTLVWRLGHLKCLKCHWIKTNNKKRERLKQIMLDHCSELNSLNCRFLEVWPSKSVLEQNSWVFFLSCSFVTHSKVTPCSVTSLYWRIFPGFPVFWYFYRSASSYSLHSSRPATVTPSFPQRFSFFSSLDCSVLPVLLTDSRVPMASACCSTACVCDQLSPASQLFISSS